MTPTSPLRPEAGERGAVALHDPGRWKLQHLGRHALSGQAPPRHGAI